jgi:hypothetical protein
MTSSIFNVGEHLVSFNCSEAIRKPLASVPRKEEANEGRRRRHISAPFPQPSGIHRRDAIGVKQRHDLEHENGDGKAFITKRRRSIERRWEVVTLCHKITLPYETMDKVISYL